MVWAIHFINLIDISHVGSSTEALRTLKLTIEYLHYLQLLQRNVLSWTGWSRVYENPISDADLIRPGERRQTPYLIIQVVCL